MTVTAQGLAALLQRQRNPLTPLDEELAALLQKQSMGIGAKDYATEAATGQFPVGTLANQLTSSILANASKRRAALKDIRQKDAASELYTILNTDETTAKVGDKFFKEGQIVTKGAPVEFKGTTALTNAADMRRALADQLITKEDLMNRDLSQGINIGQTNIPEEIVDASVTLGGNQKASFLGKLLSGDLDPVTYESEADLVKAAGIDPFTLDMYKQGMKPTKTLVNTWDKTSGLQGDNIYAVTDRYGNVSYTNMLGEPLSTQQMTNLTFTQPKTSTPNKYTITNLDGTEEDVVMNNQEYMTWRNDPNNKDKKIIPYEKTDVLSDDAYWQRIGMSFAKAGLYFVRDESNQIVVKDKNNNIVPNEVVNEKINEIKNSIDKNKPVDEIETDEPSQEVSSEKISDITQGKYSIIPIKGSDTWNEYQADKKADKATLNLEQKYVTTLVEDIDSIIPLLEKYGGQTGIFARMLPASKAKETFESLDSIEARIAFQALQDMRAASKTGGALGSIAVRELEMLGKTQGLLDFEFPEKTVRNLLRLKNMLINTYNNKIDNYTTFYGDDDDFIKIELMGNKVK